MKKIQNNRRAGWKNFRLLPLALLSFMMYPSSEAKAAQPDSVVYYYYAYEEPVRQPAEDEIIALFYRQKACDVVFWGTTDEFEEVREGYLPGFFVLRGKDLVQKDGILSFTLSLKGEKVFEKPVDVACLSSETVEGNPASVNTHYFTKQLDDKKFRIQKEGADLYLIDSERNSKKRFVRSSLAEMKNLKRTL